MRIGLVVDSSCDLPKSFIDEHRIGILPITIRIDGDELVDMHDEAAALEFYRNRIGDKGHDAESLAYSTEQIREVFLSRLVCEYDYVFCQTVMKSRSPIFENATKASFAILSGYREIRTAAGVDAPFALRVINTGTLFTGQGVLAAHTVKLIEEGHDANDIRKEIEELIPSVRAYAVPPDLYYVRARARKKGDRSVGLVSAMLGSALDIKPVLAGYGDRTRAVAKMRGQGAAVGKLLGWVAERVRAGLRSPFVCISYAGDPTELEGMAACQALLAVCDDCGVKLLTSVMSVTGGINTGPGTLTVGLIPGADEEF